MKAVDQCWRLGVVMALARGENDVGWVSQPIYEGVDFRRRTATTLADGVRLTPPFPPALCW